MNKTEKPTPINLSVFLMKSSPGVIRQAFNEVGVGGFWAIYILGGEK